MTRTEGLTAAEVTELAEAEAAFAAAGGRGVDLADRIDELRFKRDLLLQDVTVTLHLRVDPDIVLTSDALKSYLDEVLELPQEPANGQGEGYWVSGVDVTVQVTCPRHDGTWGDDLTCPYCTFESGEVRPVDNPGPLTD